MLPLQAINVEKVGDAEAFAPLHIPSITFHSVTQETLAILRSPQDTARAIREDVYYDSYRQAARLPAWRAALAAGAGTT